MDNAKKAAVISANKLWEAATEVNGALEKYNLYMRMIHDEQDEGKVLMTQMLKDLPGWLGRILETLNQSGKAIGELNGVRFEPVIPTKTKFKVD